MIAIRNQTLDEESLDEETLAWLEEVREKTLSDDNLNDCQSLYISPEGHLYYVIKVYSVAGADYYEHMYMLPGAAVFTEDELGQAALDIYERRNDYRPEYYAVAASEEEGFVDIQLYDQLEDHNSTADWYNVNALTGVGTDMDGNQVVLTEFYPY